MVALCWFQREIKLSVVLEDDNSRELPLAAELFRPLRQRVYGILFDLTKQMVGWRKNLKSWFKSILIVVFYFLSVFGFVRAFIFFESDQL